MSSSWAPMPAMKLVVTLFLPSCSILAVCSFSPTFMLSSRTSLKPMTPLVILLLVSTRCCFVVCSLAFTSSHLDSMAGEFWRPRFSWAREGEQVCGGASSATSAGCGTVAEFELGEDELDRDQEEESELGQVEELGAGPGRRIASSFLLLLLMAASWRTL